MIQMNSYEQHEIVFTYRPPAPPEPVVLRYERELPEAMRPKPEPPLPPDLEQRLAAIAPPEQKKKGRWGVRLFVGVSLLVAMVCLGLGVWYVEQYGWALPGSGPSADNSADEAPPRKDDGYYTFDTSMENKEITIVRYPNGGHVRLELASSEGLPELTPAEIYERVTASTVTVLGRQSPTYNSVGTGIIFSEDGYILTNCHVISGCSACKVLVTDIYGVDTQYDATLVGFDEDMDLAVLKVEGRNLPVAVFGISDDLQVGEPVYAIGNPLGVELRNTLTSGIVSAINKYGQVVGVNTIKMMSEYDTIEGLGFAIPSSLALRWVNELIEYGELQPQPVLGVDIYRIPEVMGDGATGLRVLTVTRGLSGDNAGLLPGDYIVAFAGEQVSRTEQILAIRRNLRVGDQVPVRICRNGEYLELTMTMLAEPAAADEREDEE